MLYFIAQRMPLEKILKLRHPDLDEYSFDDPPGWTADDLLSEYATSQGTLVLLLLLLLLLPLLAPSRLVADHPRHAGFITAKAGRPDLYRAGAFVLRLLHSSTIPWGFRPPFQGDASEQGQQDGIWIQDFKARASNADALARESELVRSGDETSGDEEDEEEQGSEEERDSEEEEESEEDRKAVAAVRGAFAALMVEGGDDSDEDEEDSDEE